MTEEKKTAGHDPVPALEWAAAAMGLLVLLTLVFILGRDMVSPNDGDIPVLSAEVEAVTFTPAGYVANFKVSNRSSQTAAAVQMKANLGEEEATATVDYVPGRSEARGGLIFAADPRRGQMELRVTGYELP